MRENSAEFCYLANYFCKSCSIYTLQCLDNLILMGKVVLVKNMPGDKRKKKSGKFEEYQM